MENHGILFRNFCGNPVEMEILAAVMASNYC